MSDPTALARELARYQNNTEKQMTLPLFCTVLHQPNPTQGISAYAVESSQKP